MKQTWFFTLVLSLCLIPYNVTGQNEASARDKYTLLTMPYNKRPLALYKGQFQANAGYKFAVRTKSFDINGDKIGLKENGSASILHYYFLDIKYGITDFIELGAETNYMKHGIRSESVSYLSGSDQISVNSLNETKGMGDILVTATLRPPIEYKIFDFGLKGGISLPTGRYIPLQPTHSITDITATNSYTINYHFNNTNGSGVPLYLVSAIAKFSFAKLSAEAEGSILIPSKEGESIRWQQSMDNRIFYYTNESYQYFLSRSLRINASIHYQAAGWFDINLNGSYFKSDGGWTEYWGIKYANTVKSLFTLEPGYEIQVSPSLTIYQIAGIPIAGKSIDAPFYLFTTLSFNMFPFLK
jgi:hypothetical protein